LAFLSYWYRKERFADALLTGIVSQRSLQNSPLESGCVVVALIENYSTSKPFNPLNAELNPICRLLALLGAHLIFHFRGLRVKSVSWKIIHFEL